MGETFTDGVLINEKSEITSAKTYTTPQVPSNGTMNCIARLASESGMTLRDMLGQTGTIIHGTTAEYDVQINYMELRRKKTLGGAAEYIVQLCGA